MSSRYSNNPFVGKALEYLEYEESWRGQLRSKEIHEQLLAWFSNNPIKTVLDVGCGVGTLAIALAKEGIDVTAFDADKSMVKAAREQGKDLENLEVMQVDISQLNQEFEGEEYDLVICHSVLEFLPNPKDIIALFGKHIRSGGALSVEVKNIASGVFYSVFSEHDFGSANKQLFDNTQVSKLVNAKMKSFSMEDIETMLGANSYSVEKRYGVRIFSDYLQEDEVKENLQELLELEKSVYGVAPYYGCGRYIHVLAQERVELK